MLFSFRLGESASWLWAVDRAGLVLYRLPPQDQLQRKTAAALEAIRQDKPDAEAAAADLYDGLFGGVAPRFLGKARWILSLDKSLFDVPFAALMERASGRPVYVAERHVIQITPGAGYWVDAMARRGSASSSGRFLGIGDPIYNAADSRLPSRSAVGFRWPRWLRPSVVSAATPATLSLPRLPASASELDSCARAWGGPSTLLEGARAARLEFAAALDRRSRNHPLRDPLSGIFGAAAGSGRRHCRRRLWIDCAEPHRPGRDRVVDTGGNRSLEDPGGVGCAERLPLRRRARIAGGGAARPHSRLAHGRRPQRGRQPLGYARRKRRPVRRFVSRIAITGNTRLRRWRWLRPSGK